MISFRESINNRQFNSLASDLFTNMIIHNINPDAFVEWLSKNMESNNIVLESRSWLDAEFSINENEFLNMAKNAWTGIKAKASDAYGSVMKRYQPDTSPQKAVSDAVTMLGDLLNRGSRQNSRLNKPNLETAMRDMLGMLKGVTKFPTVNPNTTVNPDPVERSKDPSNAKDIGVDHIVPDARPLILSHKEWTPSFSQKKILETRARLASILLYERGVDPFYFSKWMTSTSEVNEVANWLGGAWAGLKGGLAGGWDNLMKGGSSGFFGGFRGGWRTSRDSKYDQYDISSINNAVKHLESISEKFKNEQEHQDMTEKLYKLIELLKNVAIEKPPIPEPEEPEEPEAPKEAPKVVPKETSKVTSKDSPGFDPERDFGKENITPETDPMVISLIENYRPLKGRSSIISEIQPVWGKLPLALKRKLAVEIVKIVPTDWKPGKALGKLNKVREIYNKNINSLI